MADQVEEVKRKTDIVAVVGERVKLSKSGRNFKGLCPFHSEKTPSFFVSPEMGIYRCFGCGKGGDVISFLEEFEGMEFVEALEFLAERVGVKLERRKGEGRERNVKDRLMEINHLAGEFYHFLLTEHKVGEEARIYLKKRGVSSEAIKVFKLGYAPKSWDGLKQFLVGKKGYKAEELKQVGLVIKTDRGRYYDRFRGRIMFALTDARGKVMGFAGRVLDPEAREAKYVNTPETSLYHKSELLYGLSVSKGEVKQQDLAVVVEGELDAISSWQAGVKNVVAIKGSAFTEGQIRMLERYTRNVRLALDADEAGEEATRRSISLADSLGMNVRVVRISGGKDPDEIARRDAKAWRELVKQAVNVYDFYLKRAWSRFDLRTGEGKRRVTAELAPILASINNQVEQAHYVKLVAEKLKVAEEAVLGEMRKVKVGREAGKEVLGKGGEGEEKTRRERLQEYWLSLVLKTEGKRRAELIAGVDKELMGVGAVGKVVEWLKKQGNLKIDQLVSQLPAELKEVVEGAFLMENGGGEDEEERGGWVEEVKKVEGELKRLKLQEKMRALGEEIGELEKKGKLTGEEVKKLKEARSEFVAVSRGLKAEDV